MHVLLGDRVEADDAAVESLVGIEVFLLRTLHVHNVDPTMSLIPRMSRAPFAVPLTCFTMSGASSESERSEKHLVGYTNLFNNMYCLAVPTP